MAAAAADAGERGRSWYLSKEEIERGSPSRRDGVGAAKEAQLRATYCSFIRDVGLRLQLPQITIATGIVLCHRFYLHQSHAKNEWQTVATVCIFLATKIEDTHCPLQRVVIAAHETMYKKNPVAARRINQKGFLEKRKALILVGESLLLSTIRYDFNIQHPYEPLKVALKNLGISQKEVKQAAINLINAALRTTLVVQLKPHYIAAGSLSLAAKSHNVRLPTEKGKVWWQQFDIAPKQLEAAIQQMKELLKRNLLPKSPTIQPTPAQTPVEKQQILSTAPAIRPKPIQTPVEKQQILSITPATRPISAQTLVEKQQIISITPATRPISAQTPLEKQQTISMTPAIRAIPAQTPVEKQQTVSTTPAIRPIPAQTLVEKQQTVSATPAIRTIPAQTPVEKQETTTPANWPIPAETQVEKQQIISMSPAIQPTPAQPPVEKQQMIIFPKPVLKYTYSRRGLKRPASAPIPSPGPVEKPEIIGTVGPVLRQEHSTMGGLNRPTTVTAPTPAPAKKQKIRSTSDSVAGLTQSSVGDAMPTRAPARARLPVRKQQIISTQDSVVRHARPSGGGERRPATALVPAPARVRTPVRKQQIISTQVPVLGLTQPSVGGKRRPTISPARSPKRKQQIISMPDSVLRHTDPSVGGERKPAAALVPARARTLVREQQITSCSQVSALRHTQPPVEGERRSATEPARSPVRKEQIISTPDSVLMHPSAGVERKPTTTPAPARARTPVRKQQVLRSTQVSALSHSEPPVECERRSATEPARSPVRKGQIISTRDSVLGHPSVGGERKPTTTPAPVRARTPVWKQQVLSSTQVSALSHSEPPVECERRSATEPARSPVRKGQIISTRDSVLGHPSVGGERKPTTTPAPVRASTLVRKQQVLSSTQVSALSHSQPPVECERRSATAPARCLVRKEQIISTPDSVPRHTNPSQRGLTSNSFDRHASRGMRLDSSSVHQDSTVSSARNEDSKPLRMHVDHSLNKSAKGGRPEVLTLREALRADHVYPVRSRPKDVNMPRVADSVSKKRKFQEAGEHPALVNKPNGDAWTRPQIRSVIVAPPSWKKQKI